MQMSARPPLTHISSGPTVAIEWETEKVSEQIWTLLA